MLVRLHLQSHLTVNIISVIHQAHLQPFVRPYVAYNIIKPRIIRKYAKIIHISELLNPGEMNFLNSYCI